MRAYAAGALVLAIMLVGCAPPRVVESTDSERGDCFDLVQAAELNAASNGAPQVDCARAHTTQIFFVSRVEGRLADWTERPSVQALRGQQGNWCPQLQLQIFLGVDAETDAIDGAAAIRGYFPSRDEWRRGERTVACAVTFRDDDDAPVSLVRDLRGRMR